MNGVRLPRSRRWLIGVAVLAVALGAVGVAAQGQFELPGFLPADDQRPVETPSAGQQVLVLEVDLQGEEDRVTAEIRSQQVVDNFAPKDVARSAGEWEVQVDGEKPLRYLIPNPMLDVEVESPEDPDDPFDYVPTTELDWTIAIPLYSEGQPLGATRVKIVDVATGNLILETDVPAPQE